MYGWGVFTVMGRSAPEPVLKMRALAARLRDHADETSLGLYRRKFESIASELEEAAVDVESRAVFRQRFKLVS
jgi:hypothetical protein